MILYQILEKYKTWKNMKISNKNNKSEISGTTWNEKFESPDGSYSLAGIQDLI